MEHIGLVMTQSDNTTGFLWFGGRNVWRIYLDKAPTKLQQWGLRKILGFTWESK